MVSNCPRMRSRALLAATISMALLVPAGGAGALDLSNFQRAEAEQAQGVDGPGIGSDNFTLVENIAHSMGGRGSDIEFATLTYADEAEAAAAGYRNAGADVLPDEPGIQKDIALAGTTGTAFYLYDVTIPGEVYETAAYECKANQGDTQVFTRTDEDGTVRTYTTYTVEDTSEGAARNSTCAADAMLDGNASGTFIIDISDPFDPVAVAHIPVPEGSHNGTVDPTGNYFYNSNSALIIDTNPVVGPGIEYYDITDFDAITRLGVLELPLTPASLGTESHDITFNADGTRAYSAALSQGVVIDTTDVASPEIISTFVDPTINVWHQSDPITLDAGTPEDESDDRTLLVVEDEVAGAIGTGQCPNGGVHIFDVTGDLEQTPVKLGYWNIDEARVMAADGSPAAGGCTAHVFRLYPEAGIMTISYYNGGVRVVDLGGLVGIGLGENAVVTSPLGSGDPMTQIGFRRFADSNSWAAKAPRIEVDANGDALPFTVFSNGGRGLDVLAFDTAIEDAQAQAMGRWLTPAEAEVELTRFTPAELTANPQYVCFL